MHRDRAVAIITKDDELLIIRRDNHGRKYTTLPGGGVEPQESIEDAVRREVKEETTLDIKLGRRVYEHHYQDGSSQYYYLCEYLGGAPRLTEDSVEKAAEAEGDFYTPAWLKIKNLPATLLFPLEIREWLIEDFKNGFPAVIRSASLDSRDLRQSFEDNTNPEG